MFVSCTIPAQTCRNKKTGDNFDVQVNLDRLWKALGLLNVSVEELSKSEASSDSSEGEINPEKEKSKISKGVSFLPTSKYQRSWLFAEVKIEEDKKQSENDDGQSQDTSAEEEEDDDEGRERGSDARPVTAPAAASNSNKEENEK